MLQINGYANITVKTREAKRGGGVGYWSKLSLNTKILTNAPFEPECLETIFFCVKHHGTTFTIGNIYRPPNGNLNEALTILIQYIQTLTNKNVCIVGDFNVDINSTTGKKWLDALAGQGLTPMETTATRYHADGRSTIDWVLSTVNGKAKTEVTCISDHLALKVSLPVAHAELGPKPKTPTITIRNISKRNIDNLNQELETVEWNNIKSTQPSECFQKFHEILLTAVDKHCPFKLLKLHKAISQTPWITPGLIKSRQQKVNLYKKYIKTKNVEDGLAYKNYRNRYNATIRKAKITYYNNEFSEANGNSRKMWNLIGTLTGTANKQQTSICEIKYHNCIITDKKYIAHTLNNFFTNIGPDLAKVIPAKSMKLPDPLNQRMHWMEVTEADVLHILDKMKAKTSAGPDGLSNKLLKAIKFQIAEPLAYLINVSLQSNYIPSEWKLAKVIPIYKKCGEKSDPSNYRPISLLSTLSKVLEKVVFHQLFYYLNNNNILHDNQFGFRPGHETQHAIMAILDSLNKGKQASKKGLAVLLDLRKAFDTVQFDILIKKLEAYGIPTAWFTNYLRGRQQYVSIENTTSPTVEIVCGVPQGSILGPLLFLIYINDLHTALKESETFSFADDTTITIHSNTTTDLLQKTTRTLTSIMNWMEANKLSVNTTKTKLLPLQDLDQEISLNGNNLEIVGTKENPAKLLGILITHNLRWEVQIDEIRKKLRSSCYILKNLKRTVPSKIKYLIYNALAKPHLEYCSAIWGSNPGNITPLLKLQKSAIRSIKNAKYNAHSGPLFQKLGTLKVNDIIKFAQLKIAHKAINNALPTPLLNIFHTPIHKKTQTRAQINCSNILYIPSQKTHNHLPSVQIPKTWNNYQGIAHRQLHFKKFKHHIKLELLNTYQGKCSGCWACQPTS